MKQQAEYYTQCYISGPLGRETPHWFWTQANNFFP